ncbi:hypothetical protein [Pseudomonas sp. LFM046]|uniref:hypothetical protein n=1 Tax=Pseudomonas sp. LFM046 TaxID=1608357 RepID=UPI0005CFE346|nr:hypothetical protein [Pseudomonas sp. LFM046]
MIELIYLAELRRLSLNVAAAHIAMVEFLEETAVPWSGDQMVEFERLILAEQAAVRAYSAYAIHPLGLQQAPFRLRLVVGG